MKINITYPYAAMEKLILIVAAVLIAIAIYAQSVEVEDYSNSLFTDPLKPGFLGREIEYKIAKWPEWRLRHIVIP